MEDDDLEMFDKPKSTARKGRRAQKEPPPLAAGPEDDVAVAEDLMMSSPSESRSKGDADAPPKPSKRTGGWGEDSMKSRRRRRNLDDDVDDERLRPQSPDKASADSDEEPDIPVIPDLEEQTEEDLTQQVAVAPNVAVNRVATYRELDNDLLRHAAFLTLDNEIDLKLLAKGLSAESEVQEEDKAWDWDRLFTEVTSELLTEWERKEQPEEEAPVA